VVQVSPVFHVDQEVQVVHVVQIYYIYIYSTNFHHSYVVWPYYYSVSV
jgi:hypothetical protein